MIGEVIVISCIMWWGALLVLFIPFGNKVYKKAVQEGKTKSSQRAYIYFEYPGFALWDCLKTTPNKYLAIAFLFGAFPWLGLFLSSQF